MEEAKLGIMLLLTLEHAAIGHKACAIDCYCGAKILEGRLNTVKILNKLNEY